MAEIFALVSIAGAARCAHRARVPTHLPAGVAELDAALANVDRDNFTRPADEVGV